MNRPSAPATDATAADAGRPPFDFHDDARADADLPASQSTDPTASTCAAADDSAASTAAQPPMPSSGTSTCTRPHHVRPDNSPHADSRASRWAHLTTRPLHPFHD